MEYSPETHLMPELVIIIWEDTASLEETWNDKEEAYELKPGIMHTVGWVMARTSEYITVSASAEFAGDLVGDVNCIPLGCIKEINQVLPPQAHKKP